MGDGGDRNGGRDEGRERTTSGTLATEAPCGHTRSLKPLLWSLQQQHRRDRRVVCHGKLQSDAGFGTGGYDVDSDALHRATAFAGEPALGIRVCTLLAPGAAATPKARLKGRSSANAARSSSRSCSYKSRFQACHSFQNVCTSGSFPPWVRFIRRRLFSGAMCAGHGTS